MGMKLACAVVLLCALAGAQNSGPLSDRPWDFGLWVGGGTSVPGGTKDTKLFNVGARVGKVLTGEHGSGFARGNFEWSADIIPVYHVRQPFKNATGAGFNPVNLTWNFTRSEGLVPYLEFGGGVLFTNNNVPTISPSTTNFLTHAAVGLHLFVREKQSVTVTARYEHISNAGLATPNPGVNTVQFTLGYNWFK
jgi:lipid A 3-O-deacylase